MSSESPAPARLGPLALLTGACLIVGLAARFWSLGKWPLAVDEYYFARSVQNVLHFGVPEYPCGGLYVRGLLQQYTSAALELAGMSPELAPRLIAALCSLLTLPAAYLLGRRVGGRPVGLLAVAILALSVWEIEIARFGRMYAPFQALFAWYAVFFVAYTADRDRRALAPMLILSGIGVLVWEGGIFPLLANLLVPFIRNPEGRLQRADWLYLAGCCLLFIPVYPLALADLFAFHSPPQYPPDYLLLPDTPSQSRLDLAVQPRTTLHLHLLWELVALIPAAVVLFAAVRLVRTQRRLLASLGLILAMALALVQQFELAAAVVVILLLLGTVHWRDLAARDAWPFYAAIGLSLAFWLAFGLDTQDWRSPGLSGVRAFALLGYEFVRFPDFVREVAMPWARTVPLLALGLFLLISAATLRACLKPQDTPAAERIVLVLFILLVLAASTAHPGRHETRYVFFLYPLAVIICLTTVMRAVEQWLGATRLAATAAVATCLLAFGLSEDFRPAHLWNIATEAVNFRIGMSGRLSNHYHPRSDVRAAADFLRAHVTPGQDIVIHSFPGVDFYYTGDFYFVPYSDPRYEVYACRVGTIQRWSNLPLISSPEKIAAKAATGRRVWLVLESSRMPQVLTAFPRGSWTLAWMSHARDIAIIVFHEQSRPLEG